PPLGQQRVPGRAGADPNGGQSGRGWLDPPRPLRVPDAARLLRGDVGLRFRPYRILAKAAFARAWAQPLTVENVTLGNFALTFGHSATRSAIVNTLELGIMTACVGAGLAALVAYVVNRKLVPGHQLLTFLA